MKIKDLKEQFNDNLKQGLVENKDGKLVLKVSFRKHKDEKDSLNVW